MNKGKFLLDYSEHKVLKLENKGLLYESLNELTLNNVYYSLSLFTSSKKNEILFNILEG